ncbi:MAG: RNA polymerase sigma factor [Sedimentisphaerales bacterium]|nr:RNA polymerase sigma factor [Sedimentisphaerales bacterium]
MLSDDDWSRTTIDSDSLVQRLRDPGNREAWFLVEGRYGPMVEGFARRFGLNIEFAKDARQDTMAAFAEALRADHFDRNRGRLRDFLFAIARNKIRSIRRREITRSRHAMQPDETGFFDDAASEEGLDELWDKEWQLSVRAQCLKEAQAHFSNDTYLAFHLRAIEGLSSADVSEHLGKSINAVDLATHRVRTFLRKIRPVIEEIF